MAVGDVYRLRCVWKRTEIGSAAINDFHFEALEPTILDTQEEDLWQAFQDDLLTGYRGLVTQALNLVQVVIGVGPTFATTAIFDLTSFPGLVSGEALPSVLGGIIARYTDLTSRRGRGRIYLPPASENDNTATGQPTGAYVTQMRNWATLLTAEIGDSLTTAAYRPVLWSEANQAALPITRVFARPYWAVQRDRRPLLLG